MGIQGLARRGALFLGGLDVRRRELQLRRRRSLDAQLRAPRATVPGHFDRLLEAPQLARSDAHAVDHDLDPNVGCDRLARADAVDVPDATSDHESAIPVLRQRLTELEERLGLVDPDRVAHRRPRAREPLGGRLRGIARARRHSLDAAVGAGRDRLAGEERGEVRLQVGQGRERRAARLHWRAAVDRHRRRDRRELVDRRTLEALEELPRVRREALHEPPLAFGIERIDRERRLSRSARPRQGNELAGRKVEIDGLKIVRTRAAEANREHLELSSMCLRSAGAMRREQHRRPESAQASRPEGRTCPAPGRKKERPQAIASVCTFAQPEIE